VRFGDGCGGREERELGRSCGGGSALNTGGGGALNTGGGDPPASTPPCAACAVSATTSAAPRSPAVLSTSPRLLCLPQDSPSPKATSDTAHSAHRQHCGLTHSAPPPDGREILPMASTNPFAAPKPPAFVPYGSVPLGCGRGGARRRPASEAGDWSHTLDLFDLGSAPGLLIHESGGRRGSGLNYHTKCANSTLSCESPPLGI